MNPFIVLGVFVAGGVIGYVIAAAVERRHRRSAREIADQLREEYEQRTRDERNRLLEHIRSSFGELSLDALAKSSEQFMKLAGERFDSQTKANAAALDEKKGLIDQQLERLGKELGKVDSLMRELEKDREQKYGELASQLAETGKRTGELIDTTNSLREALSGTQSRGQWGERMAEDVFRLAGMQEGINYLKQAAAEGGGRPDFTFFLPRDMKVNMDVKFPYNNYVRYLEAEVESERESYRKQFLRDVRTRVKEVTTRNYIDPEHNTVDYVILFIPSERLFAFINEQDMTLLDESLQKRVILCSPLTLFAVLAVIRASVDNFALEQTSNRILALLGGFRKQWENYKEVAGKIRRQLGTVQKSFDELTGTRTRQLDRRIDEIDQLRRHRGIESEDMPALPEADADES